MLSLNSDGSKLMARILGDIIVKKLDNHLWELHVPLEYHVGHADSSEVITVPEGFITDFASVPRAFWWLLPPAGKYAGAALVHDYLYRTHLYSRKDADDIFLEAMEVLQVPRWKREIMYYAVRMFGWKAYSK